MTRSITLPMLAVATLAASLSAQEPPRPPARPVVPPATPAPAPRLPDAWPHERNRALDELEHELRMREFRLEELTPRMEELELRLRELAPRLHDDWRLDLDLPHAFDWQHDIAPRFDELRLEELTSRLEHAQLERLDHAEWRLQHELAPRIDELRSHLEHELVPHPEELEWRLEQDLAPRLRELELVGALEQWGPLPRLVLPETKYPQDPADSVYRRAREMVNRGEYRRAAEAFRTIGQRFPNSRYAPEALYWEAFALYRIGTVADMRAALTALDQQKEKFPQAHNREAESLAMRIRGELAANGDPDALAALRDQSRRTPRPTPVGAPAPRGAAIGAGASAPPIGRGTPVAPAAPGSARRTAEAQQGANCDREDLAVRLEALSALSRIESPEVTPALTRVLQRRDECSATLRRRAVLLLARQEGAAIGPVLIDVARNDPDLDVRREAVGMLARVPTDAAIAALQQIVLGEEERLSAYAMRALATNEHPRARQALRALIERNDVSESVRLSALSAFDRASPEEAAFLRNAYPQLESRRLRAQAIRTLGRIGGPENQQWLLALARNEGESMELRSEALGRAAATAPIADVARLYDGVNDRRLKERIIMTLAARKETEAVDKLLAIARSDADPELRRVAISRLAEKKDPRTTQLLLEIINR